jgi:hypothetical protein
VPPNTDLRQPAVPKTGIPALPVTWNYEADATSSEIDAPIASPRRLPFPVVGTERRGPGEHVGDGLKSTMRASRSASRAVEHTAVMPTVSALANDDRDHPAITVTAPDLPPRTPLCRDWIPEGLNQRPSLTVVMIGAAIDGPVRRFAPVPSVATMIWVSDAVGEGAGGLG